MFSWLVFSVILGLLSPNTPLEKGVVCYEDLDYACAENQLTEALAGPLSSADRLKALYYQALLAIAWRDEARIHRIAQNILNLNPAFEAPQAPPKLRLILDSHRPKPPPKPIIFGRLDYAYIPVVDAQNDGAWWVDGHGLESAVGTILHNRYVLDLGVRWGRHSPQPTRISMASMTYWGLHSSTGLRYSFKDLDIGAGLTLGGLRIHRDIFDNYTRFKTEQTRAPYWAFMICPYIDLSYDLIYGVRVGLRWSPTALIRNYEDQPILSYLLPLSFGVRYGR